MTMDKRDQPVPLDDVAAGIKRAFEDAAQQGAKLDREVPAETVRLMDDAFGRAEAIHCSPNVVPFTKRPAQG